MASGSAGPSRAPTRSLLSPASPLKNGASIDRRYHRDDASLGLGLSTEHVEFERGHIDSRNEGHSEIRNEQPSNEPKPLRTLYASTSSVQPLAVAADDGGSHVSQPRRGSVENGSRSTSVSSAAPHSPSAVFLRPERPQRARARPQKASGSSVGHDTDGGSASDSAHHHVVSDGGFSEAGAVSTQRTSAASALDKEHSKGSQDPFLNLPLDPGALQEAMQQQRDFDRATIEKRTGISSGGQCYALLLQRARDLTRTRHSVKHVHAATRVKPASPLSKAGLISSASTPEGALGKKSLPGSEHIDSAVSQPSAKQDDEVDDDFASAHSDSEGDAEHPPHVERSLTHAVPPQADVEVLRAGLRFVLECIEERDRQNMQVKTLAEEATKQRDEDHLTKVAALEEELAKAKTTLEASLRERRIEREEREALAKSASRETEARNDNQTSLMAALENAKHECAEAQLSLTKLQAMNDELTEHNLRLTNDVAHLQKQVDQANDATQSLIAEHEVNAKDAGIAQQGADGRQAAQERANAEQLAEKLRLQNEMLAQRMEILERDFRASIALHRSDPGQASNSDRLSAPALDQGAQRVGSSSEHAYGLSPPISALPSMARRGTRTSDSAFSEGSASFRSVGNEDNAHEDDADQKANHSSSLDAASRIETQAREQKQQAAHDGPKEEEPGFGMPGGFGAGDVEESTEAIPAPATLSPEKARSSSSTTDSDLSKPARGSSHALRKYSLTRSGSFTPSIDHLASVADMQDGSNASSSSHRSSAISGLGPVLSPMSAGGSRRSSRQNSLPPRLPQPVSPLPDVPDDPLPTQAPDTPETLQERRYKASDQVEDASLSLDDADQADDAQSSTSSSFVDADEGTADRNARSGQRGQHFDPLDENDEDELDEDLVYKHFVASFKKTPSTEADASGSTTTQARQRAMQPHQDLTSGRTKSQRSAKSSRKDRILSRTVPMEPEYQGGPEAQSDPKSSSRLSTQRVPSAQGTSFSPPIALSARQAQGDGSESFTSSRREARGEKPKRKAGKSTILRNIPTVTPVTRRSNGVLPTSAYSRAESVTGTSDVGSRRSSISISTTGADGADYSPATSTKSVRNQSSLTAWEKERLQQGSQMSSPSPSRAEERTGFFSRRRRYGNEGQW